MGMPGKGGMKKSADQLPSLATLVEAIWNQELFSFCQTRTFQLQAA
jgi:hypothetical protein